MGPGRRRHGKCSPSAPLTHTVRRGSWRANVQPHTRRRTKVWPTCMGWIAQGAARRARSRGRSARVNRPRCVAAQSDSERHAACWARAVRLTRCRAAQKSKPVNINTKPTTEVGIAEPEDEPVVSSVSRARPVPSVEHPATVRACVRACRAVATSADGGPPCSLPRRNAHAHATRAHPADAGDAQHTRERPGASPRDAISSQRGNTEPALRSVGASSGRPERRRACGDHPPTPSGAKHTHTRRSQSAPSSTLCVRWLSRRSDTHHHDRSRCGGHPSSRPRLCKRLTQSCQHGALAKPLAAKPVLTGRRARLPLSVTAGAA